jgi:hypothetical protein
MTVAVEINPRTQHSSRSTQGRRWRNLALVAGESPVSHTLVSRYIRGEYYVRLDDFYGDTPGLYADATAGPQSHE